MSTAEAAASLFGSDDAASDLFASLGTDSDPSPSFGPDTSAYPAENAQPAQANSWTESSHYGQQSSSYLSDDGVFAPPVEDLKNTTGTGHAQWQQHDQQTYTGYHPAEVQDTAPAAVYDPGANYNPYAPTASHSVPATPPGQLTYHHYAPPPVNQSYAAPSAPISTSSQSAYSAYTPATPSTTTYTSPYSVANTPYVSQKAAVVPPPPAPAPVLNRPKLSNAYDPPFPTSRPSRRGVSASARSSAYNAYSQAPLPPPLLPSGGQFTPSGYALPPPLPSESPKLAGPNLDYRGKVDFHSNAPLYNPDAGNVSNAPPPRATPDSFAHQPSGEISHPSSSTSFVSGAQVAAISDMRVLPAKYAGEQVERYSSPAPNIAHPSSRTNSISSQTSGRSLDTSLPRPSSSNHFGAVDRTSSPMSFSTRSRTVSPEIYPNGLAAAHATSSTSAPDCDAYSASINSQHRAHSPPTLNPYLPNSATNGVTSALGKPLNANELPKAALPANEYAAESAPSPGSSSLANGLYTSGLYLPPKQGHPPPALHRNRSESSGSIYASISSSPEHSYAPSLYSHGTQHRSESDYGNYVSRYNYNASNEALPYDISASQEILVKPVQTTAYAPSPSLLGANDPLGRTSSRAPVFSFGFGGKFLTCFHGVSMNTGFDVALSSRNSTGIHIRHLNKIIPQSALESSSASFPGPLFSDPGTPTSGLVRTTTASAQSKAKKARLVKYLSDRADEISQGIGYLHAGSVEGRQAEGKLVLVNLLKILVENDGRLTGTPQIDAAVRRALVPKLEATNDNLMDVPQAPTFASIADVRVGDSLVAPSSDPNEAPIATSILRPSALDKIQDFLLRGERRKAYHYALDEKLWAHAMIIASSIDRDAWKETVNEFLRTELGAKDNRARAPVSIPGADTSQSPTNGREGLRVAYSLFSGQGSASVQELVPQNLLSRATGRLQLPPISHMTPMTPNFAAPALANNIPAQSLALWAETAAMMLSSPLTADTSTALTALGDQLLSHQWVEAAHACYLLSPQTSHVGGIGNPSARIVLLGSRSPQVWPGFFKDSDPVVFTEILEFGLSLAPPVKGQDPFYGLPHLQAYRFIRAMALAELGELQLASRYCEAITASFSRGSPYFTGVLLDQLKALSDRIVGLDHSDKSGFWKSTPSLDTIGRFLEGRFTKLVTGDVDPATPVEELPKPADPTAGPFSQYSTISSATSSTSPSPQPSLYNLNLQPARSGSAMGQSTLKSQAPIDRASSAMDHVRRRPSPPAPRIASANASTTTFAQAPSFGQAYNNYSPNPYSPSLKTPRPNMETTRDDENGHGENSQEVSWWGSSSYGNDSANQTPMAATFHQIDSAVSSSADGFISLMDDTSYSVAPTHAKGDTKRADEGDEDDLGFGNSKRPMAKETEGHAAGAAPAAAPPQRPDIKPAPAASGGSWLGRWWKRPEATPGPVKASLGEETSFYYDKDLKRWVNKKAGAADDKPAAPPPPPPSRPQSAAPGMSAAREGGATPPPPPARSASAAATTADLGGPPPSKSMLRVRSNLAPTPESSSMPSSPLRQSTLTPSSSPPPPGRPKSQASKRAIRSRYVDVFQQEGGAA